MTLVGQERVEGPLPEPEVLAKYGEMIDPKLPMMIAKWAEQEGRHRRDREKQAMEASIKGDDQRNTFAARGQFFGLIVAILALVAGCFMVALSDTGWGETTGGAGLILALSKLVWGPKDGPVTVNAKSDAATQWLNRKRP